MDTGTHDAIRRRREAMRQRLDTMSRDELVRMATPPIASVQMMLEGAPDALAAWSGTDTAFGRAALQALRDAGANPCKPDNLASDLHILYRNALGRATTPPDEQPPWGEDEQKALHRLCHKHLSVDTVIHVDNAPARRAFAAHCAERGVSREEAWRDLVAGALLSIVDDKGYTIRVGGKDVTYGECPAGETAGVGKHVATILRREVEQFLFRRPPGSNHQHVLTTDGVLPLREDPTVGRGFAALEVRDLLLTALNQDEYELLLRYVTEDRGALAAELDIRPPALRKQAQRVRDKAKRTLVSDMRS